MKKPKAILFDWGETIVDLKNFNPLMGTCKMLEVSNNPNHVSAIEVQNFAEQLLEEWKDNPLQFSCRSFHKLIYESYGVSFNMSSLDLEILFIKYSGMDTLMNGVLNFLDYLAENDIKMAIISNSSFSHEAHIAQLKRLGIDKYFEFFITTADYCIMKPDKRIFSIALNRLRLAPNEVCYIGNSFKYDVIGAHNSGTQPIWLNVDGLKPEKDIPHLAVGSYFELLTYYKSLGMPNREGIGQKKAIP